MSHRPKSIDELVPGTRVQHLETYGLVPAGECGTVTRRHAEPEFWHLYVMVRYDTFRRVPSHYPRHFDDTYAAHWGSLLILRNGLDDMLELLP